MRILTSAILAVVVATGGSTAAAQTPSDAGSVVAFLQRLTLHYAVMISRSFVDLTYDQLSVEPGTDPVLQLVPSLQLPSAAFTQLIAPLAEVMSNVALVSGENAAAVASRV